MTELLTTEETYLNHLLTVKNVKGKKNTIYVHILSLQYIVIHGSSIGDSPKKIITRQPKRY